jgi:hypothetical protein
MKHPVRSDFEALVTEAKRFCSPLRRRQKIATFIPSTFARSSSPDLKMSATDHRGSTPTTRGNPFISDYETAVMA